MPRSGYSRTDPITIRPGYVSQHNDPVDRRGGPETHSGRVNHARMNERASPDTFMPSLDARSRDLHIPHDRLFSSTASDFSNLPSRDDLHRSEPSLELERRSRGYNPGYFGGRVSSYGSSPQLGGLDHGYRGKFIHFHLEDVFSNFLAREKIRRSTGLEGLRSEPTWMTTSERRKEARGEPRFMKGTKTNGKNREVQQIIYPHMYATPACANQSNANLTKPQLQNEDEFDRRQSLAATGISKSYQSVAEKRNNHNNDYIGHWPREERRGHKGAVIFAKGEADKYSDESQRHVDVRRLTAV